MFVALQDGNGIICKELVGELFPLKMFPTPLNNTMYKILSLENPAKYLLYHISTKMVFSRITLTVPGGVPLGFVTYFASVYMTGATFDVLSGELFAA